MTTTMKTLVMDKCSFRAHNYQQKRRRKDSK